jgi:hypothetical protein
MRVLNLEHRRQALAPPEVYHRRLFTASLLAGGVIAVSLAIGVLGYHYFGGIEDWVDCLYSASMILGGMGPVAELKTRGGKIFASIYALYSGVTLLTSVGVLLAPALHRALHYFHIETEEDEARSKKRR